MNTYNKVYDGMAVMVRLALHSAERTLTRLVNNNDIEVILDAAAPVLYDVATVGMEVNIVCASRGITLCVAINEGRDYTTVVDVITVIDDVYRHPQRNNLIIAKDGVVSLSGLLTGKMPAWLVDEEVSK